MKAAAVQFAPALKDKEGNLRRIAGLVAQAVQRGAKIVVLPELCTTGYTLMSAVEAAAEAEVVGSGERTVTVMLRLAAHYNVVIVWGMVEQDLGTKTLHNTQVLVSPHDGFVSYRKINLWGNDFLWAKAGRGSPPVLRTSFGRSLSQAPSFMDKFTTTRLGLLVCRDVRDKARHIGSFYEKGDADVVLMSANWGRGGFPAVAWMDFVQDNKIPLVVANRYGVEGHNDFGSGGSCIIQVDGTVVTDGLVMGQDCIVTGEV
jgi:predicted amidohydrolase